MSEQLDSTTALRYARIRRVKKLLRPMPRRTNLHKYPVIKWFANYARKCSYIWSFKRANVISAIYLGWIIALIPMYGLQMLTAFILCLPFRANCLVAMALQWITNPLSIPFIMVGQYMLGDYIIVKFFNASESVGQRLLENLRKSSFEELLATLWNTISDWGVIAHLVSATLLGGFIIAICGAIVSHIAYALYLKRFEIKKGNCASDDEN